MDFVKTIFLIYVLLPIFLGLAQLYFYRRKSLGTVISLSGSVLSLGILAILVNTLENKGLVALNFPLIDVARIELNLQPSPMGLGFLILLELTFGFFLYQKILKPKQSALHGYLLYFGKASISWIILCANPICIGVIQIIAAALFAFLLQFSVDRRSEDTSKVSVWFFINQALAGILFFTWAALNQFVDLTPKKEMVVGQPFLLWISLALSMPVAPLSNWLESSLVSVPKEVSVLLCAFVGAVLFRHLEIGEIVFYSDASTVFAGLLFAGMAVSALALFRAYISKESGALFSSLVQFLIGVALFSYGLMSRETFGAGMALCSLLQLLLMLCLVLDGEEMQSVKLSGVSIALLFLIVGFPGTAVFSVWANIGERAFLIGPDILVLVGILWFFYLLANILYFRKIISLSKTVKTDPSSEGAFKYLQIGLFLVLMLASWYVVTIGAGHD